MLKYVFFIGLLIFSCTKTPPIKTPRLTVFLTVDQLSYDILTRYRSQYDGGFKTLLNKGISFENTYHNFAVTETSPGHATVSTGTNPLIHGIVSNTYFDQITKKMTYAVDDSKAQSVGITGERGKSPVNLNVPTFGDYIKEQFPKANVFSVSGKDRSAILLGGKNPNGVYWYSPQNGKLVTSTYYRNDLPPYIETLNKESYIDFCADSVHQKFRPKVKYDSLTRQDKFDSEFDGVHTTFPYRFGVAGTPAFYSRIRASYHLDRLIIEAGKRIIKNEQLGKRGVPDLLLLGLSATDYIGHSFGPYSQEMLDQLLRLDRMLQQFFTYLDEHVGLNNTLIILTSDHGALPMPEDLQHRNLPAKRINPSIVTQDIDSLNQRLIKKYRLKKAPMVWGQLHFSIDREIYKNPYLMNDVKILVKSLPYVSDLFHKDDLIKKETIPRPFIDLYRNSFDPERSPEFYVVPQKFHLVNWYFNNTGTNHGSPYEYDRQVPLIFYHNLQLPMRRKEMVFTTDIAPSVLYWLKVSGGTFQGKSLFAPKN